MLNYQHFYTQINMKFLRWISWFNREKITLLIASLALTLGAISPWYRLPEEALATFNANLFLANAGKLIAAVFAFLGFVFTFRFSIKHLPRLPFWIGLIAVFTFSLFHHNLVSKYSFHECGLLQTRGTSKQACAKKFPQSSGSVETKHYLEPL